MSFKKYEADVELKGSIENCVKKGFRNLLFLFCDDTLEESNYVQNIGEKVMVIHYLMNKCIPERPSILWCHKSNSITPSLSGKMLKKLERKIKSGQCDIGKENALHLFLLSTKVRFCEYSNTQSVLGNTYNICVMQDFEGLTPNMLCRVSETVCGGGAIIFLISGLSKLKDLYNLHMDVHGKLTTWAHQNVNPLFNERFVLSLANCKSCLVLDKNLKLCCEFASQKSLKNAVISSEDDIGKKMLEELMESLLDAEKPLPQLCKLCSTMDQAKAVLKMIDVLTEKNGHSTVSLSAARGRGKSSALGLAVAAAIFFGVNNIFVVSPYPENLTSFFEFLFKGFDALEYQENTHYSIIQSTNPEFKKAIVRVNVFARHRQNIQYVSPSDFKKISQAELVVIDEAAAIPLVHVKALLGSHNVLMASTINGYEGTGRSLSLKLLQQLRQQSVPQGASAVSTNQEEGLHQNCRPLFEISLEKSIRYSSNDPVEKWLKDLLCLDATSSAPAVTNCPSPFACDLYYVNKDVLFSGHKETETFLHQIMSLLVASHYRNSPDDLQILCDAPAHHIFVLIPPLPTSGTSDLPNVFCVIQVCEEGAIPTKVAKEKLMRGERPNGDLIPWTIAEQFFNPKLTKLKGIRVIRVATHSDYQSMGYGSRAMSLLVDYYENKFISLDDEATDKNISIKTTNLETEGLIAPRQIDKPLLMKLSERNPEVINYIGVSFGITDPLFRFWKKLQFKPVYISLVTNKITAEHNCIMLHSLSNDSICEETSAIPDWLKLLNDEFIHRFTSLLGAQFNSMHPHLVHNIISSKSTFAEEKEIEWHVLQYLVNGHDLQRLESYAKHLSDRQLITDLLPALALLYFDRHLPAVHLSTIQSCLLIGCGFQYRKIEEIAKLIDLPIASALGQFNRAIRRILNAMAEIQERTVTENLPESVRKGFESFKPISISLDQDLEDTVQEFEGGSNVKKSKKKKLHLENLDQYVIKGDSEAWNDALHQTNTSSTVTIKSAKRPARMTEEELEKELEGPGFKKDKRMPGQKKAPKKSSNNKISFNSKKDKRKRK